MVFLLTKCATTNRAAPLPETHTRALDARRWEILKDPFGALAIYSFLLVVAPFVGFFATATGCLDPLISIFYTIPEPWGGRGLTSFVMSIVSVNVVIAFFIRHAFNEVPQTQKAKKLN